MLQVKRLRPDWNVRTYVIPISRLDTNDEFWDEARNLRDVWNEVVATYRSLDEQVLALEATLLRSENDELTMDAVRTALKNFSRERKNKTREKAKALSPKLYTNDLESLCIAGNRFELRLPTGNMISAYLKNTIHFLQRKALKKTTLKISTTTLYGTLNKVQISSRQKMS